MNSTPKVSVIMPSLNVGNYIRECIESVVNQTMREIEIICVDAGSTDGTLEVLQEYAAKDKRIQLIHSNKKSYGYQMNLGLDAAKGEYIGIVETDDYAELNMFEILWHTAYEKSADMVRCNYFWYTTKPTVQKKPFENLAKCTYGCVFRPLDERTIFNTNPSIWSGIYKREMLFSNNIRFNETPGASYQDASFHLMTCTVSSRCYLLQKYLLYYRYDNENSSVRSQEKVFCVSDEMHYYENFLNKNPKYKDILEPSFMAWKEEKYRWNYERLAPQFQWEFLQLIYNEFLHARSIGLLCESEFDSNAWNRLNSILDNPIRFFQETCKIYSTRPNLTEVFPYVIMKRATITSPKFSVVVPSYNSADYISETLDSLISQTEQEIEIICIDDGSQDNTSEILFDYAIKDQRITIIRQVNKGLAAARNVGLSIAKGEFVYFLDSDDLLLPEALEKLYIQAQKDLIDVLYFDGCTFFESIELQVRNSCFISAYEYIKELPNVLTGKELFCIMNMDRKYRASACLAIYRRTYLEYINIHFLEGIFHEDNYFTFVCMISCDRVSHTSQKFLRRRVHSGSIMTMPKSFLHLYGYLISFIKMWEFASSLNYNKELLFYITNELDNIINLIRKNYSILQNKDFHKSRLNSIELLMLNLIVNPQVKTIIKNISLSQDADLIRSSVSYKIGRIITWLPRKIRDGIRCYRENGFIYTCVHALQKLTLKRH